ncbi:MAG TPA: serine hydrolase domain-containing protein [Candidatus Limnocylindrales bacterium]|nr:serine hydrolase domain-containing protein [Candidatus Limnocylindrales bacterium]
MSRLAGLDREAFRQWLAESDFSGVVHVAGDDDEEPLAIAMGQADRVAGLPNHAGTRFGIASTTKLFTGLTVARLVDRGVVRYEDRLVDLLAEDLRPLDLDPRVMIHQLLSHTSGVGDYADEYDGPPYETIWESIPPTMIRGPRDMVPLLRDLPRTGDPGEAARYNNGAYVLVGLALEIVSGRSFPDLVRAEVFGPLGMTTSGFWAFDGLEPDLADGYLPPDPEAAPGTLATTWRTNIYSLPAIGLPDGGAQATATDLVRALDGLTGRGAVGAEFLTPTTRERMIGPHAVSPVEKAGYGLGVIHGGEGPSARIGHAGEDPGFSSRCWAYRASGERVVVQSNVTEGAWHPFRRLDELLAAVDH